MGGDKPSSAAVEDKEEDSHASMIAAAISADEARESGESKEAATEETEAEAPCQPEPAAEEKPKKPNR